MRVADGCAEGCPLRRERVCTECVCMGGWLFMKKEGDVC